MENTTKNIRQDVVKKIGWNHWTGGKKSKGSAKMRESNKVRQKVNRRKKK